jgi:hypothetical protein
MGLSRHNFLLFVIFTAAGLPTAIWPLQTPAQRQKIIPALN